MLFGHGMVDGEKVLVLHIFNGDGMVFVRFFCLQCRQCNAAATDHRVSQTVDGIAADRADIELGPQHIGGDVPVDNMLAVHQLNDGDAKGSRQWLQKRNIRQSFGRLPLGDGLAADSNFLSQLRLRHMLTLPKMPDGRSGYIGIHGCHVLSEKRIPQIHGRGNLRCVDIVIHAGQ